MTPQHLAQCLSLWRQEYQMHFHYILHPCCCIQGAMDLHPKVSPYITVPNVVTFTLYVWTEFALPKCITSHLYGLNSICHCSVQLSSWSFTRCIFKQPSLLYTTPLVFVLSENLLHTPQILIKVISILCKLQRFQHFVQSPTCYRFWARKKTPILHYPLPAITQTILDPVHQHTSVF